MTFRSWTDARDGMLHLLRDPSRLALLAPEAVEPFVIADKLIAPLAAQQPVQAQGCLHSGERGDEVGQVAEGEGSQSVGQGSVLGQRLRRPPAFQPTAKLVLEPDRVALVAAQQPDAPRPR